MKRTAAALAVMAAACGLGVGTGGCGGGLNELGFHNSATKSFLPNYANLEVGAHFFPYGSTVTYGVVQQDTAFHFDTKVADFAVGLWQPTMNGILTFRQTTDIPMVEIHIVTPSEIAAFLQSHQIPALEEVEGLTYVTDAPDSTGRLIASHAVVMVNGYNPNFTYTVAHEFEHAECCPVHSTDPADLLYPIVPDLYLEPSVRDLNTVQGLYRGILAVPKSEPDSKSATVSVDCADQKDHVFRTN